MYERRFRFVYIDALYTFIFYLVTYLLLISNSVLQLLVYLKMMMMMMLADGCCIDVINDKKIIINVNKRVY